MPFFAACAGGPATIRPVRPPLPDARALEEFELVCQPDEAGCRPTQIRVEVCASELEAGCAVRDGIHDLLSELEAYDRYVAELRGDEVPDPD